MDTLSIGMAPDQVPTNAMLGTLAKKSANDYQLKAKFKYRNSNYTCTANAMITGDTTSGSWTLKLPKVPKIGDYVIIHDYAGTWDTYNIFVDGNGNKIMGVLGETLDLDAKNSTVYLSYIDDTQGWRVV